MPDIQDTLKLARAFGDEVQAVFTPREFRAICAANKSSHARDGICATHDYCDANMLMHHAFLVAFDRDPLGDGMTEADTQLWNDAWTLAKAAEFFA